MLPHHRVEAPPKPRQWAVRFPYLKSRSLIRLLVAGIALCIVSKIILLDLLMKAIDEMFFARYVDGKHCEILSPGHLESKYHNASDCFSNSDIQQIILGLVFAVADVFEQNKIPYWLDSGTLLGSHREKTVIPYDNDADIGIDEATYIRLRDGDERLEFPSVYKFTLYKAKHREHGGRDDGIPGRLIHTKSGLYVDIFVFMESKTKQTDAEPMFGPVPSWCFGSCVRCPKVRNIGREFKIPKSWVFPLKKCWFGGREVSCPAETEKYLDYLYGPTYMTPQ
ncbi:hypothetical protein FI667_g6849, partial [Globisporangium splendens]